MNRKIYLIWFKLIIALIFILVLFILPTLTNIAKYIIVSKRVIAVILFLLTGSIAKSLVEKINLNLKRILRRLCIALLVFVAVYFIYNFSEFKKYDLIYLYLLIAGIPSGIIEGSLKKPLESDKS